MGDEGIPGRLQLCVEKYCPRPVHERIRHAQLAVHLAKLLETGQGENSRKNPIIPKLLACVNNILCGALAKLSAIYFW